MRWSHKEEPMKYICESRQYFGDKVSWGQRKTIAVDSPPTRAQAALAYAEQMAAAHESLVTVRVKDRDLPRWGTFEVRRGWYIEEWSGK